MPRTFRITHWMIATAIILNYFFLETGEWPHRWLGYAAAGSVLIRWLAGFFDSFPRPNKIAPIVYNSIWLLVLGSAVTGWMMSLDQFFGDDWLETIHSWIADGLAILATVHLLGLAAHTALKDGKLWKSAFIRAGQPKN